ncbi:MAG TPA: Smr/MutS family protein [Devosiaceae bacterium]
MAKGKRNRLPPLEDWHLWAEVTRSVTPLRPEAKKPLAPEEDEGGDAARVAPAHRKPERHPNAIHHRPLVPASPPSVSVPGIEPKMRRRLMRGQMPLDGRIDLHGMRQDEARAALRRFVLARAGRGDRTILVITGKGLRKTGEFDIVQRGVLRAMLPIWLAEPDIAPVIAGYEMAAREHGGEGAYYVRLRKVSR